MSHAQYSNDMSSLPIGAVLTLKILAIEFHHLPLNHYRSDLSFLDKLDQQLIKLSEP